MPDPTPAERVTRALQRAHANAERHAETAAQDVERVTLQHRHALQNLADHLAEIRALAAALAERGASTLAEEAARMQREHAARMAAGGYGLTISAPITTGRLVAIPQDVQPARTWIEQGRPTTYGPATAEAPSATTREA